MNTINNKKYELLRTAVIIGLIIFLVLGLYIWNFGSYGLSSKPSDWASFGGYVGGVLGTCFAFVTFWMLFSTFRLQQVQTRNIEVQKFETTFYSLLELHNQKLRELDLHPDKLASFFDANPLVGKALSISDEDFKEHHDYTVFESKESKNEAIESYLDDLQSNILKDIQLSQYFRVLYQLLKYIARNNIQNPDHNFDINYLDDRGNLSIEYEKMYSSIARGFVPVSLLPVLALNCIATPNGLENLDNYQSLLERYDFLEHIRFDLLPKNLAIYVILNNYNHAFGNNRNIEEVASELKKKYEKHPLKPESYFLRTPITVTPKSVTDKQKTHKEKWETHFDRLGKGFYSDEATVHEVAVFYFSNLGTALFYTTVVLFIFDNKSTIYASTEYFQGFLFFLSIAIPSLIALYIFWVTVGRIAVTLGRRDIGYPWAFIITITILILWGFVSIVSSWM